MIILEQKQTGAAIFTVVRTPENPLGPRYTVVHENQPTVSGRLRDYMRYDGPDREKAEKVYEKWARYERGMEY